MATTLHTKITALSALTLLSALSFAAHADKLADIKAAGVVKVATFTPTRRLAQLIRNRTISSVMTSILLKRWRKALG